MIAVASKDVCGGQQVHPVSEGLNLEQLLQENRALHCEKNYYKSLHERAKAREELLEQEVQQLKARIRYPVLNCVILFMGALVFWPRLALGLRPGAWQVETV